MQGRWCASTQGQTELCEACGLPPRPSTHCERHREPRPHLPRLPMPNVSSCRSLAPGSIVTVLLVSPLKIFTGTVANACMPIACFQSHAMRSRHTPIRPWLNHYATQNQNRLKLKQNKELSLPPSLPPQIQGSLREQSSSFCSSWTLYLAQSLYKHLCLMILAR